MTLKKSQSSGPEADTLILGLVDQIIRGIRLAKGLGVRSVAPPCALRPRFSTHQGACRATVESSFIFIFSVYAELAFPDPTS